PLGVQRRRALRQANRQAQASRVMVTAQALTGLRLRPFGGAADLADIARLESAEAEADGLQRRTSLEEVEARMAHASESFDPGRDVTMAEIDGQVVAVAQREVVDTTDGLREYRLDGAVDPAWRRRGIGRLLLDHNERVARELAAREGAAAPVLGSWSWESQLGDSALLGGSGFEPVRWFFDMVRPDLSDIPGLELPAGLEIRPIDMSLARRVWHADIEAFADHWAASTTRMRTCSAGWTRRPPTSPSGSSPSTAMR